MLRPEHRIGSLNYDVATSFAGKNSDTWSGDPSP
jgi:hypothetical protein